MCDTVYEGAETAFRKGTWTRLHARVKCKYNPETWTVHGNKRSGESFDIHMKRMKLATTSLDLPE